MIVDEIKHKWYENPAADAKEAWRRWGKKTPWLLITYAVVMALFAPTTYGGLVFIGGLAACACLEVLG